MTPLAAEMRRRLWNTIIEISLQASISKGGPPLLSMTDFDAEMPGNIPDEALIAGLSHVPNDNSDPTIMSVPRALRGTYPVRLKVTKFLNDLNTTGGTYEETLQLDTQFREAFKELRRSLHPLRDQPSAKLATQAAELIMNRYLASLHMPYFAAALHAPAYAFSRQVLVEILLKIWCATWPSSSIAGTAAASAPSAYSTPPTSPPVPSEELLARMITCGSGFFRTAAAQVSFTIPMELHEQLQDDGGLGPTRLRRDLAAVTEEVKAWSWRCMEAGETSVKGFLMSALLVAQTEALQRGPSADKAELARFLIGEGEKAAERCVPLLEATVEATKQHEETALVDEFGPSPGLTEDWDFTVSFFPPLSHFPDTIP
ncbi:putative c6 transcription [Diaporthe ampelina]|uniref:Putative c6 transcription n=1 Tax=Diaporthe ampelina TaxID=1214573 RepID=A0A0G2FHB9_9PEZI|nr:putative c6 transcription [Diaporthe ampelina]